MLSAIEPRLGGRGRGYEPRRAPFQTDRAAEVTTTLIVDDSQLAVPYRVENRLAQRRTNQEHTAVGVRRYLLRFGAFGNRLAQRRTNQEHTAVGVRRYLLGFGALDAPVGRVGVPLHAGLVPGA